MSKEQRKPGDPREGGAFLERIAKDALEAFRRDCEEEYDTLVKKYDDSAVAVGVFGVGAVTLAVTKGEVHVNPPAEKCPRLRGRGAVYPETVIAIAEGRTTALDAFHRGDLLARAESSELHRAYEYFVRFSDAVMRSKRLQKTLQAFREEIGI
jgi:hypothetical protein